ncbi:hypothetical protein GGI21_000920 [Coemansia aciculifera]|nr:hypothetical protein GGI21_000920 [Coemansia aciculifera]
MVTAAHMSTVAGMITRADMGIAQVFRSTVTTMAMGTKAVSMENMVAAIMVEYIVAEDMAEDIAVVTMVEITTVEGIMAEEASMVDMAVEEDMDMAEAEVTMESRMEKTSTRTTASTANRAFLFPTTGTSKTQMPESPI